MKTFTLSLLTVAVAQEQVHLSLTGATDSMAIDFVSSAGANTLTYGTPGSPPQSAPVDCKTATLNTYTASFCTAVMTGLAKDTLYTYTIKDASIFQSNFTNQPARDPVFVVYADFGYSNDESLAALIADSNNNVFDYVIHAGDWGAFKPLPALPLSLYYLTPSPPLPLTQPMTWTLAIAPLAMPS
jgi:hypothetical protein